MYYGARYYDPALSRFITADTVYDRGPQGLNRYSYALNNSIRYNDPSGQSAETWEALTAGGGGVALWQALKEVGRFFIPSPAGLAGGVVGAIPLIFHASNVGEGSDEIPPPTIPDDEVPAGPEGPQKKPKRPPSGNEIVRQITEQSESTVEKKNQRQLGSTNETSGSFTNLGSNPGVHNAASFDSYPERSGFSGVYDVETGKWLAYPSGRTRLLGGGTPDNLVDRFGGHGDVNEALSEVLGADSLNRLGFIVISDGAGGFEIRWNSRTINGPNTNFVGRTVPEEYRQQVIDAIKESTEKEVYSTQ